MAGAVISYREYVRMDTHAVKLAPNLALIDRIHQHDDLGLEFS